jgi:hypothetical protein
MSNLGLWCIRYLIVVPTFYHPHLPYRIATYVPTFVECAVMAGTWIFSILFFALLLKLLPVIELPDDIPVRTDRRYVFLPRILIPRALKKLLITGTMVFAIAMIVYGLSTWQGDYAPLKWLTGIAMLCTVPLQVCILIPREELARPPTFPRARVEQYLTSAVPRPVKAPRTGPDRVVAGAPAER